LGVFGFVATGTASLCVDSTTVPNSGGVPHEEVTHSAQAFPTEPGCRLAPPSRGLVLRQRPLADPVGILMQGEEEEHGAFF